MAVERHSPTRGDVARYLSAERPTAPVEKLGERYEYWRKHGELPEVDDVE